MQSNADKRYEIFKHFDKMDNPVVSITTEISFKKAFDASNAEILAAILKAANEIENFRYRLLPGFCWSNPIVEHKKVDLGFTVHTKNEINTFKFATASYCTDWFDITVKNINQALKEAFKRDTFYCKGGNRKDLIYVSLIPGAKFTAVQQPFNRDTCDVPAIIAGSIVRGKLPISISAHHGLIDGYHIGLFCKKVKNILETWVDK